MVLTLPRSFGICFLVFAYRIFVVGAACAQEVHDYDAYKAAEAYNAAQDQLHAEREERRAEWNAEFEAIVRDASASTETQLEKIAAMQAKGFDLNGRSTKHVASPMESLISYGTPELVSALLARGLELNPWPRLCQDQYWFTQGALMRRGGFDIFQVLVDAGFRDDCLRTKQSMDRGVVCGVAFGWGGKGYNVTKAVEVVDFLAAQDFPVNVKCLGKTLPEKIEAIKDPELQRRLSPIAEAVRQHAAGE